MTVSEYIFDYLNRCGVDTVYMVSGSSAMWLTDSLQRNENLKAVCTQHEQAATMAADLYGRLHSNCPGVALVTVGPGATNAITGVAGAYTDSSPIVVLSGQSGSGQLSYQKETGIRQMGNQSVTLDTMVSSITKYFAVVMKPEDTRYHIERAVHAAVEGRPGPVWLDVPVDIQNKQVPLDMEGFMSEDPVLDSVDADLLQKLLNQSKKPLILAGGGASVEQITRLSHALEIPVVTTRMGIGNIASDDPLFVGRPGSYGDRPSHFAIQQADLLLILGCRLAVSTVGYYPGHFAGNAIKLQVDIDPKELAKDAVPVDYRLRATIQAFVEVAVGLKAPDSAEWRRHCAKLREKFPVVLPEYRTTDPLNSYYFTELLTKEAPEDAVVVVDTGSVCNVVSQTWQVKKGQRYCISGGLSCMGYWASALGGGGQAVLALSGDGSVSMNIQEFATLAYYKMPVKLFVYNNQGYMLIRHNQHNYMNDRFLGVGADSGVPSIDFCRVADAYGLPHVRIEAKDDIPAKIRQVLEIEGPVICEVMLENFGPLAPRISSRVMPDGSLKAAEFDDLAPFLTEEEKQV